MKTGPETSVILLLTFIFSLILLPGDRIANAEDEKSKQVQLPSGQRPKLSEEYKKNKIYTLGNERNSSRNLDGRWNQMDTGPILSGTIKVKNEVIAKGISIQLGNNYSAGICFDSENLSMKSGWTGGFLKYNAARFGLVNYPEMVGHLQFSAPADRAWKHDNLQYHGLYMHDDRILLSYSVDGTSILETPGLYQNKDKISVFSRTFKVGPSDKPLTTIIADPQFKVQLKNKNDDIQIKSAAEQPVEITIAPRNETIQFEILIVGRPLEIEPHEVKNKDGKKVQKQFKYPQIIHPQNKIKLALAEIRNNNNSNSDIENLKKPGSLRWGNPIKTTGTKGKEQGPFVIDTINLPHENRFKALLFVGDHDYFSKPDKFALCTVHGDVWLVEGVDEDLKEITFRRFATGLYQALGLKIIEDKVYVLGRDQITRLHDYNNDGEADFYEAFAHSIPTSEGRHHFATCLETDPEGNFFYINETGVHKVSKDGKTYQHFATGFRNPNGMSVGPDGTVTGAPQEGTWTPSGGVFEANEGEHYGFGGPKITTERPLGYSPPMAWIPRELDNSTGSQVWIDELGWEPLKGTMLNLSYGHCKLILMALEKKNETLNSNWPLIPSRVEVPQLPLPESRKYLQAASVSIPELNFESGIMRGCFSPHDGHLYLSGLRGWTTSAVRDGCFQRVRYTGKPLYYPIKIATLKNGLAITFSQPLDKDSAEDPDSYFVEKWNYWYSAEYGSPEYKVSNPREEGRDPVGILSATLIDSQTVFLELEEVSPVMQMGVHYFLDAADGTRMKSTLFHTINRIRDFEMDPKQLVRKKRKRTPGRRDHQTTEAGGRLGNFEFQQ